MTETEDLSTHVSLCELRYKALEKRLDAVEERISKLENQVTDLQREMSTGFHELKILLERQSNQRHTQILATAGTITVALIGLLGYIITR